MIELGVLKETIRKFMEMLDDVGKEASLGRLGKQAETDMIM